MPGNCVFQKAGKKFVQGAKSNPSTALVSAVYDLQQAMMISDELVDANLITPAKGCLFLIRNY